MPDLERLAADELIVIAPKADPTKKRAASSAVRMHEGVDLVARKAPPGIVQDGVGCLSGDAQPPVSTPNDHTELDVGVLEFGDALKPALADERPGRGIPDRPETPAFGLPAAFVGLEQTRGDGATSRPAVDVDHHAWVGEERGGLVEIGAAEWQKHEALGAQRRCVHPLIVPLWSG